MKSEHALFESAPVRKVFFTLTVPVVLGMLVSLIYNMADTYFIARTGSTDLVAGVSLCAPVLTVLMALGNVLGLGGSSLVSRLSGAKDFDRVRRVSSFSIYCGILLGIVSSFSLLAASTPVLKVLGADTQTLLPAGEYYFWLVLGAPFLVLSYIPMNLLRAEGLAKESMAGSILGTVVNLVLDPLFISVLGFGAGGAAMATVIGTVCSDIYYVYLIHVKCRYLSIRPRDFACERSELLQILAVGIPASVTNLMTAFSTAMTNRFLLPYGNEAVATMGVSAKISLIPMLILVGFAFGSLPLTGYCYGAGNYKRLRETLRFAYGFELILSVVLAGFLFVTAGPIITSMLPDASLLPAGRSMLRRSLLGMPFVSVILVTSTVFQAAGKGKEAMILALSRQGFVFVIIMLIVSSLFGYNGVITAQPVADLVSAALAVVLFKWSGLWELTAGKK